MSLKRLSIVAALLACMPAIASAQVDSGDTAWILTSTALVMLMTPGLAFFYAGMVRSGSVVATLYKNVVSLGLIGIVWAVAGYSLAFSEGSSFIGGSGFFMLNGVTGSPDGDSTIPHILFMSFQMMFAVITPVLISGAIVERMNLKAWLIFIVLWSLVIYSPVCHWVWGGGLLSDMGAIDFAGGLVVHMTAGFSALAAAIVLGKRADFGKDLKAYDNGYILLGTAALWLGWFGFNGGSALAADGAAAVALTVTFFSAGSAFLGWALIDRLKDGKVALSGACIGAVVGLVVITPAAGNVGPMAAIIMGLIGGIVCNYVARAVKGSFGIDDSLDVFACHGVGGLLGTVLLALFASEAFGGVNGLFNGGEGSLIVTQIKSAVIVAVYSFVVTFVLLKVINVIVPIRSTDADEKSGLDEPYHGEKANSGL